MNDKTGFSHTTSFVYQFSVVWSVSKFIEQDVELSCVAINGPLNPFA